jgi:hypothetical protein
MGSVHGGPFVPNGGFVHASPFVHGGGFVHTSPFVHGGGFVHASPFVHGGGFVHASPFVHGGFVHGGVFRPAPVHFFHPYYTFRPYLSLGYGLWMGYPFAYPYAYYDPYYYPYSPYYVSPYGYPPYSSAYPSASSGSVDVQPSQTNTGGISFDVTPSTAQLFVDGRLVGTVGQFTPTTQPLGLNAGHHHVELRASGYHTMSFDLDIIAGQVIPYQGALEQE